jgi:hypothetical protein
MIHFFTITNKTAIIEMISRCQGPRMSNSRSKSGGSRGRVECHKSLRVIKVVVVMKVTAGAAVSVVGVGVGVMMGWVVLSRREEDVVFFGGLGCIFFLITGQLRCRN